MLITQESVILGYPNLLMSQRPVSGPVIGGMRAGYRRSFFKITVQGSHMKVTYMHLVVFG